MSDPFSPNYDNVRGVDSDLKAPLWMIIYTDMITNLMIFFLMSYCLTWLDESDRQLAASSFAETFGGQKNEVMETEKGLEKKRQTQMEEQEDLEKKAKQQFANVEINEEKIKIVLPSPVLFDSGSAELKAATIKTLSEISNLIKNTTNRVVVEGHTDNIAITAGGEYASNWELSAARAFSVIQYLIDKEGIEPKRISALGYGEFRPKAPNDNPENRMINRRIEISIIKIK
ncbi:MAG TPA: hypothetical protein DEE98_06365 [Elusimicrobia bacterium]|nr:MAG: hypothetical protein A2278_02265 [Elusimicrobia bacterium RIFOXYA12_FULL_49_49]OGS06210.1 MAG: hypothetical protein A2204_02185 [Elusimicrobia bacterium RIFOXYA1_FULL_47_7]OGS16871.1 MAG: hypothetical protein A2251_05715 [Elusimicrobia bacterium RIFOXYA2_FULL_47_53]OGS32099.1 MAG: hypothetical protein A2323_08490 [Elusimicrobia bacterium RIFOXYB2_FULL_46_23]HBU69994.1 hypothetical protein [Elusimicrobiota bacterium]